eukprot:CAMPEP_0184854858 /NCGR_PEP_ID=MMETSP0580-20130426/239_1 /TAXON_ID=1118495 /ORGANISM="Dactyliosolen fragilissimus" /LENGTH=113 /DNA_ID=CAMNT_0027349213 /DNA_START=106 /DNA_END=447 /DNA_ORIENTATION=-
MTPSFNRYVAFLVLFLASASNAFMASQPTFTRYPSDLKMTVLNYNGKKKNFKPGSPLKNACANLGVKPRYSCKKGDCGSCTISVGGTGIKACVGKVPPEPRLKSLQENGLVIK